MEYKTFMTTRIRCISYNRSVTGNHYYSVGQGCGAVDSIAVDDQFGLLCLVIHSLNLGQDQSQLIYPEKSGIIQRHSARVLHLYHAIQQSSVKEEATHRNNIVWNHQRQCTNARLFSVLCTALGSEIERHQWAKVRVCIKSKWPISYVLSVTVISAVHILLCGACPPRYRSWTFIQGRGSVITLPSSTTIDLKPISRQRKTTFMLYKTPPWNQ